MRDFPFIKQAVGYNGAFQPADLVSQNPNIKRLYTDKDFLYNLGGKFFRGITVVPMKEKKARGFFGRISSALTPSGIKGHSLNNFKPLYGLGLNVKGDITPLIEIVRKVKSTFPDAVLTGSSAVALLADKKGDRPIKEVDDLDFLIVGKPSFIYPKEFKVGGITYTLEGSAISSQARYTTKEKTGIKTMDFLNLKRQTPKTENYKGVELLTAEQLYKTYKSDYREEKDKPKLDYLKSVVEPSPSAPAGASASASSASASSALSSSFRSLASARARASGEEDDEEDDDDIFGVSLFGTESPSSDSPSKRPRPPSAE